MNLKQVAFKGASWSLIGAIVTALIQILRPAILTRYLEKSDFGLMAILMLVLGFTQIFSDLGISVALFSEKNLTKKEYSSLYWISLLLAFFLFVSLILTSPLIAAFYELTILKTLIPIIALDIIFSTVGRQFQIIRRKNYQFKSLAAIDIGSALISFLIAVILALQNFGIYSLIYSALAASLFKSGYLFLSGMRSHPISFHLNFRTNTRLYKIGIFQTGSQILDYVASQIDIIVVSKVMNTADLGLYNLIKQLVIRPYGLISSVVTTVSIPLLASLNDQLIRLKSKFLEMIRLVVFINIAIYAIIALFAAEIVTILYGASYVSAAPILRILCLWGVGASITNSASTLIAIFGKTQLGFVWTIIRVLTNPLFIIAGSFYGIEGISWGNSIVCLLYVPLYYRVVIAKIMSDIKFQDFWIAFSDLLPKGLLLFGSLYYLKVSFVVFDNIILNILPFLIVFIFVYIMLNRKIVIFLKSFIKV